MTRVRLIREQRGQAMIIVLMLSAVLGLMATLLLEAVSHDTSQSGNAVALERAHAAAEAGLDDYVSKLLDDNQYYLHYLAPGESTRHPTSGANVSAVDPPATPTVWPPADGRTWTYPSKDNWYEVGNGYAYNLQITPPRSGSNNTDSIDIVASGAYCPAPCGTPAANARKRVIEELIRPATVADFQMMANASISYGNSATTTGKLYAGCSNCGTLSEVDYNVNHAGTAAGNIYAEGNVTGSPNMTNGAKKYDSSGNPGTIGIHDTANGGLKTWIDFSAFQSSLSDISRAAQSSGIYLNNNSVDAWWLTFNSDGTVDIKSCTSNSAIQTTQPACGSATNYAVPANGAIYAEQSVIVAGGTNVCGSPAITGSCVKGRVTVASNNDVVIGDDIDYVTSGTDTLGLIAKNDMIVAKWAPDTLSWRAATIAQTGSWFSATSDGSHTLMTFTGSTATDGGGQMSMFDTRVYNYDQTLSYLQPPWFPTIGYAYTVILYRELPAS